MKGSITTFAVLGAFLMLSIAFVQPVTSETSKLQEMLKKIEKESESQVRDIWLEHFLEKTRCPKCKKTLNHFDGKIWCEDCGFRTNY